MGEPILWKSQIHTEMDLSSTESEYTGLSYALQETLPVMKLIQEIKYHNFNITNETPKIKCRVF